MLISSFVTENGTPFAPLVLFSLQVWLVVTNIPEIRRVVEYTPKKFFDSFVQSAVDARREKDESTNTRALAEKM